MASSSFPSRAIGSFSQFQIPFSFFANLKAFEILGVTPEVKPVHVSLPIYLESLKQFDVRLEMEGHRVDGDTHFAFLVPEVAAEDLDLLEKMIENNIATPRFVACLLMVDFSNPIYSLSRASLLKYVPQSINSGNVLELEEKFLQEIQKTERRLNPATPEGEFFSNWSLGSDHWIPTFEQRLSSYFDRLGEVCQSQEGYDQIVRLAESRRHEFKKTPQFEFDLTFATTNISVDSFPLEMSPDGRVKRLNREI